MDADFSTSNIVNEPPTPPQDLDAPSDESLSPDEQAVVWWVVVFTCVFQTLHSLSFRAVAWLLQLLGSLLVVLGHYSSKIGNIAHAFPSTLHQRTQYLKEKLTLSSICRYVVCPACLSLYNYEQCLEKRGTQTVIKSCSECDLSRKHVNVPLLKTVITSTGSTKYYPKLVYPYTSLISSLQSLLSRPGFYQLCERWRQDFLQDRSLLSDVYDGKLWKEFLQFQVSSFLAAKNSIALMMTVDWFQPYKHRIYSVGVIYMAIMNLPRPIRFKRENIIIIGLLPGPTEPSKNMNTYLTLLVSELLSLWDGVSFVTPDCGTQMIRSALLCVGCDLPSARALSALARYLIVLAR